jgi:hypothetical protein
MPVRGRTRDPKSGDYRLFYGKRGCRLQPFRKKVRGADPARPGFIATPQIGVEV